MIKILNAYVISLIVLWNGIYTCFAQDAASGLDYYKQSISLIAVAPIEVPIDFEYTIGTGISFIYQDRIWLLTCKHVVEPALGKFIIKSLLRIKSRGNTKAKDYLWNFGQGNNVRYHAKDSESQSHDLALFFFNKTSNNRDKFDVFKLPPRSELPNLIDGEDLVILGYPKKNLSYKEVNESDHPLPLNILRAKYLSKIAEIEYRPRNYDKIIVDQEYAILDSSQNVKDLDGMSGGLVLVLRHGKYLPVGMFVATGKGQKNDTQGRRNSAVDIAFFAHFRQIYSLLQNRR